VCFEISVCVCVFQAVYVCVCDRRQTGDDAAMAAMSARQPEIQRQLPCRRRRVDLYANILSRVLHFVLGIGIFWVCECGEGSTLFMRFVYLSHCLVCLPEESLNSGARS